MRRLALLLALLGPLACATNQAHLEWRPGLSAIDFNGLYELGFDEYREHREQGEANLLFDRWHGVAASEASPAMAAIGERLRGQATRASQDQIVGDLSSGGRVTLVDARGEPNEADLDYFAASPDRRHAALVAGSTLAVVIDRASIAIDVGSLLGPSLAGWQVTMRVTGETEITVFALPELGGAPAPDEPGYVFEFGVAPQASRPWDIGVGRISVSP